MEVLVNRPLTMYKEQKAKYPDFFNRIEVINKRPNAFWLKEGCYCPTMFGVVYFEQKRHRNLNESTPDEDLDDSLALTTALTWGKAKFTYNFDDDLTAELIEQARDNINVSSRMVKLPVWCIYVRINDAVLDGMYIRWEVDMARRYEKELLIIPVRRDGTLENFKHLSIPRVPKLLSELLEEQWKNILEPTDIDEKVKENYWKRDCDIIKFALNVVLYLTSANSDIVEKTNGGAHKPGEETGIRVFSVGENIGERLREFHLKHPRYPKTGEGGHHKSPVMHIRNAHWHTYLYGKGKKERRITWQAPIIVMNTGEEIDVVTVTHVKKEE